MRKLKAGLMAAAAVFCGIAPASAEPFPRVSTADGSVISRRSGEEVRFIDVPDWRGVEINQDLLAGDTLRTNANGSLAILFSDSTQMRMGRNTTLIVKKIDGQSNSEVELSSGVIWARAKRGGSGLIVETPAAAAAIRGTDWTLRVDGDQTTLTVLEGTVELANPQGSVTVNQGEGAVAAIGQAPRKYTLVNLEEREQILLYGELRGAFATLPASGMDGPRTRAERARILAVPEAARTQADWLALAEATLSLDGRAAAVNALAHLKRPLPGALESRAKLVEAMIAGQELRYQEAERLFTEALPDLPASRKATAAYGRWFAAALADPNRETSPPPEGAFASDPAAVIARATALAHVGGTAAAIDLLRQAEKRFPDDARLPAMRAGLAYELDRRDEVREALDRARRLDPDDPTLLLISARSRATVSSDLDGALADLRRAVEIAPGADAAWNELGIVYHDRNAPVEANRAYREAIALNPENAVLYANYARFLMDNDQVKAAKQQIDIAERLDPTSYAVLAAKGRYLLRMGKTAEGEQVLLQASAVNPTYGDALIGQAIASYQLGSEVEAAQALDNADRFDPENPSIPLIRSGIALDQYRADEAIIEAREALRRRMARGGYYSGYDPNRQTSSFLGITLENLGLDDWGRYYADRGADPFMASTYFDEAASGRLSPFIGQPINGIQHVRPGGTDFSAQIQGLLLDPLALASEQRRNSIERRSFVETALGLGGIAGDHDSGWTGDIEVQGTNYAGFPVSYYLRGETARPQSERDNDDNNFDGALFQFGLRPTLTNSVFLFGHVGKQETGFPGQIWNPAPFNRTESRETEFGAAWSHTISDRNMIQAFIATNDTNGDNQFRSRGWDPVTGLPVTYRVNEETEDDNVTYGISHLVGIGPLTLRYGAEAARHDSWLSQTITDLDTGSEEYLGAYSDDGTATRVYADTTLEVSRNLQFQGGIYVTRFDGEAGEWGPVDPRIGVAWSPLDGQWLRAYYRQDTQFVTNYTLSPISTVGLTPDDLPLYWSGQSRTAAVRWDAEWSENFFTAVEYQRQTFTGLTLAPEDLLTTFNTWEGEIDRIRLSANYWLGGGIGLFGSFSWNESKDTTDYWNPDLRVPLVPDYVGRVGFTYVHPARITGTVAQTFVGERVGSQYYDDLGEPVAPVLDAYTTTDAAIGWKSESGQLELGFLAQNIFDQEIDMADGLPAAGRTFLATMTARF
ncbi:FecR domain-containing protein [Rhizobium sp. ARZ01]|uniref:FecR domain-containing protein n=1 Tax=Rhizobium sp. ARZ01 TaxID=2769313 RepID=UPI00177F290F|nr:FecR domain-containing protein [Rhizobium sp. ARZ01]MBD9372457.1 FecR domain-containing protein [Rhizobium sp. ARZ01]